MVDDGLLYLKSENRYVCKDCIECDVHMVTQRRIRFLYGQTAWMLGSLFILTLLDAVTLELVFVIGLIGFLVVIELTAPFTITPTWRRRLKWLIAFGLLIFAAIVIKRILAVLPPGVL